MSTNDVKKASDSMDVAKKGKKRPLHKSPEDPKDGSPCKDNTDPSAKKPESQPSPKKGKLDPTGTSTSEPSSPGTDSKKAKSKEKDEALISCADSNPKVKLDESVGDQKNDGKSETNPPPLGDADKSGSKPSSGIKSSFAGFSGFGNSPSGLSWGLGE